MRNICRYPVFVLGILLSVSPAASAEDAKAPALEIVSPVFKDGDALGGTIHLVVKATPNEGFDKMRVTISGQHGVQRTFMPGEACELNWDTTAEKNGSYHNISVMVSKGAYAVASANRWFVTKNQKPDNTPPAIEFSDPKEGTPADTNVFVSFKVTDEDSAVDRVELTTPDGKIESYKGIPEDQNPMLGKKNYTLIWDSTKFAEGNYVFKSRAWDAVGNKADAISPSFTVKHKPKAHTAIEYGEIAVLQKVVVINDLTLLGQKKGQQLDQVPPSVEISQPTAGQKIQNEYAIVVYAQDKESGIAKIEITPEEGGRTHLFTESPCHVDWNTRNIRDGEYTITAKAIDKAGNEREVKTKVTVANEERDKTIPEIEITSPADDVVKGVVRVTVKVNPDQGYDKLRISITSPGFGDAEFQKGDRYEAIWDTTQERNGAKAGIIVDLLKNDGTPVVRRQKLVTIDNS